MRKPLLFYVIDERTDEIEFCKRRGLLPYKYEDRICYCSDSSIENQIIKTVVQYEYKGYIYDVLENSQCYSGYMLTLMRLPKQRYEELLKTALTSKENDEMAGSIGMILKDHPLEFEGYLYAVKNMDLNDLASRKSIKRVATFISGFVKQNISNVRSLERILSICEELALRLK